MDVMLMKILKPKTKKCCMCNRPVYTAKAIYCLRCHKFNYCMKNRRVSGKEAERIRNHIRKNGYVCEYTKVKLNLDDKRSPWYFQFDHETPGDKRRIRLTCALINEMKSDMSWKEFKGYILQIARFLLTGEKIKQKKLKYWFRLILRAA
jgi:hypothetical protein